MLCFNLRLNERFFIGDSVVEITKIGRDRVYVSVDADGAIPVDREQVRNSKLKMYSPAALAVIGSPPHLTAAGVGVEELLKGDGQI